MTTPPISAREKGAYSKYGPIVAELKRRIADGSFVPGERMPSFEEMRATYGLGSNTINRIFLELESAGLVERHQGRGVYVAERKRLRHRVIGLCGIYNPDEQNPAYYAYLQSGVRTAARQHGMEVLLLDLEPSPGWEKADGMLVHGYTAHRPPIEIPTVTMMIPVDDRAGVSINDYEAGRKATEHLLELGHRRIGFLGMIHTPLPASRLAGYREALHAAGIADDVPRWRNMPDLGLMRKSGKIEMERWLCDDWKELGCTALVAQNDHVAIGILQALAEAGLRVPEEVSVIGFDGTDECELCTPHLTSMELPLRQIGERAANMLIDRIENDRAEIEQVVLPTRLVVRESTARPKRV